MKSLKAMAEDKPACDAHYHGQLGSCGNLTTPEFTTAALEALAAHDAAQTAQIPLALKFGETLDVAKRALGRGKFRPCVWRRFGARRAGAPRTFASIGNAPT
jgi:hypothetical protein